MAYNTEILAIISPLTKPPLQILQITLAEAPGDKILHPFERVFMRS